MVDVDGVTYGEGQFMKAPLVSRALSQKLSLRQVAFFNGVFQGMYRYL